MGYGMHRSGLYIVADLDDSVNCSLGANTGHSVFSHIASPHFTKVVRIQKDEVRFPLAQNYQAANETLLGREQFYGNTLLADNQFPELNWQLKHQCNRLVLQEIQPYHPHWTEDQLVALLHGLPDGPWLGEMAILQRLRDVAVHCAFVVEGEADGGF